ncbi:MAG: Oxidoreductase molybdopterin binding domain protein [Proteobacteria bacterium]|nr:Oxidoreductase molybdopterin binding domain protein [Pseudomonadota bacterium]
MALPVKIDLLWSTIALLLTLTSGPSAASAGELGEPTGEVILTISGSIKNTNNNTGVAEFDLPMLEALAHASLVTTTPWTVGPTAFEGVAITDLLAAVGASGSAMTVTALNDYIATVPVADAQSGAILAYRINGAYFSIREKGPLWLMYPFDTLPQLRREEIYARSVWQIRKIDITAK